VTNPATRKFLGDQEMKAVNSKDRKKNKYTYFVSPPHTVRIADRCQSESLIAAVILLGRFLGGRGCASRKSLLLCLPLITCRFYEKVRIANANRFRISAASAAPPKPIFR
jgi:hypothetical protein